MASDRGSEATALKVNPLLSLIAARGRGIDSNDDASVNIGDPIYLLSYLFADGPPPPPPFPVPGSDPEPGGLGCGR